MKRLLILVSLMIFASCSSTIDTDVDYSSEKIDINSLMLTKSAVDFMHGDYSISLDDISTFLKFNAKGKKVVEISPISLSGDKVQGYLVSFDEGWELISADKRTNAVLAEGGRGHFSMDASKDQNEGRRVLLESFLDEVGTIQSIQSEQEAESVLGKDALQEMENNVMLWDLMTEPGKVLSCPETKVIDDWIYVLDDIQYDTVVMEVVDHLIETNWTQNSPYNQYFPYTDQSYSEQAPTGCVPIAGAQMLNFLHNKLNVLISYPLSAHYVGTIFNYVWNQSQSNTFVSGTMYDDEAATFVTYIAHEVGAAFLEDNNHFSTIATITSLQDVFNCFGIETQYYNEMFCQDSVRHYIMDKRIPVITGASHYQDSNLIGHCFIIDAGKHSERRSTFYYKKHYANGNVGPGPIIQVYEYPVWEYGINWGYGAEYNTDWYISTGSWNVGNISYNYHKSTLLGYTISD